MKKLIGRMELTRMLMLLAILWSLVVKGSTSKVPGSVGVHSQEFLKDFVPTSSLLLLEGCYQCYTDLDDEKNRIWQDGMQLVTLW